MHDPMTVAFDVPGPVPRRKIWTPKGGPRWGVGISRRTNPENLGERTYPWWRPRGYTLHLAGRAYELRTLVTVWHVEPDGRDSGEVCSRWRRHPDGTAMVSHAWRWHVHHWRIQVPALQAARRWLLTRCEWCGGPSRRGRRVNVSHQWDREPGPWWRGDRGLFHTECSSAEHAARTCVCDEPVLEHRGWGRCARCSLFRGYGLTDAQRAGVAVMQRCPRGQSPTCELIAAAKLARVSRPDGGDRDTGKDTDQ